MRAVLDTTVLISALLAPGGRVASIINRLAEAAFILVYSEQLMTELLRVLGRPYVQHLNERRGGDIDGLRDLIRQRGALVLPTRAITMCRDPKDDCVLEAA